MKTRGRCPVCGSRKIGQCEYAVDLATEPSYQALGTMFFRPPSPGEIPAATRPRKARRRRGSDTTKAGTLETRVCTECGNIEHYVQDPQWVPFSRLDGFRWVNAPGEEP